MKYLGKGCESDSYVSALKSYILKRATFLLVQPHHLGKKKKNTLFFQLPKLISMAQGLSFFARSKSIKVQIVINTEQLCKQMQANICK